MAFLEQDLEKHRSQPIKFIVSHRPSWIIDAGLGNSEAPLHRIAKKYGVRYVIAGHLHKLVHIAFDRVTYLSMESSGGHLRGPGMYEEGWFYGHTQVEVRGNDVTFQVEETGEPYGRGRTTRLDEWDAFGAHGTAQNSR